MIEGNDFHVSSISSIFHMEWDFHKENFLLKILMSYRKSRKSHSKWFDIFVDVELDDSQLFQYFQQKFHEFRI